ncbi:MAG: glycosyltransferase family 4 protein [Candidatus Nealsonbacteria bacterium]|nr:glycosyltransferase family 4 protein [Candidatus Nealsonbacteria bacterium]
MENVNLKKKVFFLVTQSEFGGAQRYIYELIKGISPEKYEFIIAAGEGDKGLNFKFQTSNVKTISLRHLKRTPGPLSIFRAIIEIVGLLKKERPDVLFLCSTTAGILGSIAGYLYKRSKIIYRIGGWAFKDPRNQILNFLILLAEKLTALLKDVIIVNNEEDLRLALKYRVAPKNKLVKIYNGIDANKLEFLPKEEARSRLSLNWGIVVGTVANFYKTKGLEYLIKAISNLKSKTSNLACLIIGDGRERKKLEALIKKHGLESTVFLAGRIPDAYKYLKAFDVFVLPSLKEGFPWIILEAMAAELPIVATRVGALPEIINDGVNGFLIKPGDSQEIAEKIVWLSEHPSEAIKMAGKARERIEKGFGLQEMVQKTEKLL